MACGRPPNPVFAADYKSPQPPEIRKQDGPARCVFMPLDRNLRAQVHVIPSTIEEGAFKELGALIGCKEDEIALTRARRGGNVRGVFIAYDMNGSKKGKDPNIRACIAVTPMSHEMGLFFKDKGPEVAVRGDAAAVRMPNRSNTKCEL